MKIRMIVMSVSIFLVTIAIQITPGRIVLAGNNCHVPVFTTDAAPNDGMLVLKTQMGGDDPRRDTLWIKSWEVAEGQQINDIVPNVPAPRWARLWWWSFEDATVYLLPSQYWHGDGTSADLYGVSCGANDQPSYHTSFSSAIPESQLPTSKPCFTAPLLINPPNDTTLNTLTPYFQWNPENEPDAAQFKLEIARDSEFKNVVWSVNLFLSISSIEDFHDGSNLEPSTTYYWRASYICSDGSKLSHEAWTFTTGSDGVVLPPPNIIAPADGSNVVPGIITFQWEPVDGATEYYVKWRDIDSEAFFTIHSVSVNNTQYQINTRPSAVYEWSVAARNDYATGEFAEAQFTTSDP